MTHVHAEVEKNIKTVTENLNKIISKSDVA